MLTREYCIQLLTEIDCVTVVGVVDVAVVNDMLVAALDGVVVVEAAVAVAADVIVVDAICIEVMTLGHTLVPAQMSFTRAYR